MTTSLSPLSETFDSRFHDTFGQPGEGPRKKVLPSMSEAHQAFIRQSPFLVMATAGAAGHCDASPRGGMPGFVRIVDDRHLLLPDVKGNRRFDSYRNIDENPHVGLLFMVPGSDRTVRVNGTAHVVDADEVRRVAGELSLHNPDEDAHLLQGLLIEVEQASSHCPRSFTFSDVWNTDTIQQNRGRP
jgi:PPOX class probable FMN-dependent enzyme